jgi:hypothetical protein
MAVWTQEEEKALLSDFHILTKENLEEKYSRKFNAIKAKFNSINTFQMNEKTRNELDEVLKRLRRLVN